MQSDQPAPGKARRFLAREGLIVLAVAMTIGILVWLRVPEPPPTRLTDVLSTTLETGGIDATVAQYRTLREEGFPGLRESESDTNRLGYQLLRRGETESAIQVLRLNAETHPRSANVHDSLGEAYAAAGNKALAIESYRRAVAIDPRSKTAVSALQKLTNGRRKPYRPMVLFHICAGMVGLASGALALSLRKGSRRHGAAGGVFVLSMLSMSASAPYLALAAPDREMINALMGILTFYLVATAWLTARRKQAGTGILDWGALLVALAVAAGLASYGLEAANSQTGTKDGIPAGLYFFFGGVALLAAALDLRMIARGGVVGAQRIARHLWRMCGALFIAVTSLFLGQPQVFPDALRNTGLLVVPSVLVVSLLIFWLVRVSFASAYRRTPSARPERSVGQTAT